MKLSNKGVLAAAWFALSLTYIVFIARHVVRAAFVTGKFAIPKCLDDHILEDLLIPFACLIAALFLQRDRVWPRIILGLAAAGLIFVICMVLLSSIHHKPYPLYAMALVGCVWTLVTVTKKANKCSITA